MPEILERLERLNRKKDGEVNYFIIEVHTEKICVDEAKALGAVAFGVDANFCENDVVEGELGVDPVDDVNFMEIGGYRVRTLFQKQISRTFPGLFQDFSRTQIDFSRALKFTLTLHS